MAIATAPISGLNREVAPHTGMATQARSEAGRPGFELAHRRAQADRREAEPPTAHPPAAHEPPRQAAFRFEYADNTRIMKLQDSKGILIYQIPSKGQLAILQATEAAAGGVDTTA
jgi:hypothetical protein